MNTTIGYKRVSLEEQLDGHSMDSQDNDIESYCKLYKLSLKEIITDEGLSGRKKENRPGFQRLMSLVENKGMNHVVVPSFTRFARNTIDTIMSIDKMTKHNIAFHSISERIETTGAYGKFMTTIFAALSQLESDKTGERIKSVKKFCKNNKRSYSKPILGFDNMFEINPEGKRINGKMIPNEKELVVVKKILELNENTSQNKIAQILNESGIPTKEGKQWHQSTIRYVLNNPIYKTAEFNPSYLMK